MENSVQNRTLACLSRWVVAGALALGAIAAQAAPESGSTQGFWADLPRMLDVKPEPEARADSKENRAVEAKTRGISLSNVLSTVVGHTAKVSGTVADNATNLVGNALNFLGVRYRYGGNTPEEGLDCSGFVRYVFSGTLGSNLPRRAVEMSNLGLKVGNEELKPGDLVFFNTMRHTFSHVGIYIGENKFVHAPSTGSRVRVDDMRESYWQTRYDGARRLDGLDEGEIRIRLDAVAPGFMRKDDGRS
jgi:cell wall-associated NlpC family hydrolase